MQHFASFLFVFLGGGFGSLCRFGIGTLVHPGEGKFPWATLIANGLACFILGIIMGLHLSGQMTDQRRLLLGTGFCGGLSTFSTFIAESWGLYQNGQTGAIAVNVLLSLALCAVCLILGLKMVS